jgi:hypothetical protein
VLARLCDGGVDGVERAMALVVSSAIVFNININRTKLERSYTTFDGNPDTVGLKGVAGDVHDAEAVAWDEWWRFLFRVNEDDQVLSKINLALIGV